MRRSLCILCAFLCSIPGIVQGQETPFVRGQIWLDTPSLQPAVGAFVHLNEVSPKKSMRLSASDESGTFLIKNLVPGIYHIRVTYLGYHAFLDTLRINSFADSLYLEITLLPDEQMLQTVEVSGQITEVTQHEDTLRYHAAAFRSPNDRTLGHLLKKMPGMEISESGQISYNGKRVQKVLVEGKEVINEQHRIATEGIHSRYAAYVDIIEGFDAGAETGQRSDAQQATLNIRLYESGKQKLIGSVFAGGGLPRSYEGGNNALRIQPKYGLTFFSRAHNTGKPVLTAAEYLASQGNLLRWLNRFGKSGELAELIPSIFLEDRYLQNSDDQIVSFNLDARPSEKWSSKTRFMASNLRHVRAMETQKLYPTEGAFVQVDQRAIAKTQLINVANSMAWRWNRKGSLELELPFSWQSESLDIRENGSFNNRDMRLESQTRRTLLQVEPQAYLDLKIDTTWSIRASLLPYLHTRKNGMDLSDFLALFSTQEADADALFRSRQNGDLRNAGILADFSAIKTLRRHKLEFFGKGGITSFSGAWQGSATPLSFTGDYGILQKSSELGLRWSTQWSKLFLSSKLGFNQIQLSTEQQASTHKALMAELSIRYNWNRFHYLMIKGSSGVQTPSYGAYIPVFRIMNNQLLETGHFPLDKIIQNRQVNLLYFFFHIPSRIQLHSNFTFSSSLNAEGVQSSIAEGRFIQLIHQPVPERTLWTWQINGTAPIHKSGWRTRVSNKMQQTLVPVFKSDGTTITVNSLFQHFETSLHSPGRKKQEVALVFSLFNHQQTVEESKTTFQRWIAKLDWTFLIHTQTTGRFSFGFNDNRAAAFDTRLPLLHFLVRHQIKNSNTELSLEGYNLLNLNGRDLSAATFSPFVIENIRYRSFPGYILMKADWSF